MANRRQKIEQEVDKTLASLEQAPRLSAGPWFVSQVHRRMEALDSRASSRREASQGLWFLRPALLILIVTLNLVIAVTAFQRSDQTSEVRETYVSNFATEYGYSSSDTFFALDD